MPLLLPVLFFVLVLSSAARAQFAPAPLPTDLSGFPDAARMRFGYITVPENRANPVKTIRLAVVIIPALSSTPQPDPVFYVVGGPGGSATLSSGGFPVFKELNKNRDIVFLDPRGAGLSDPNLFMRREGASIGEFTRNNRSYFQSQGIDISAYNTTEIAQDYEAARIALGYTQINLFANSYGTFVAQEILRRFPANLRAVVMSGNSPATDPFLPATLPIEKHGIDELIRDVRHSRAANRAFPHFSTTFYKVLASLNEKPVKLRVKIRHTTRTELLTIDGRQFLDTLSELLQRTETIRLLPLLVQQLEKKSYNSLVRSLFEQRDEKRRDNSFGMYLSVLGTDFGAPGYVRATERGVVSVHNRTLIRTEGPQLFELAELVVNWGAPYNPGNTRTLPQSLVRTLFLNGRMDAQTPVSGGALIALGVPNSINYVYPRIGHGVGFDYGPDLDAAVSFLENPAQPPAYSTGALLRRNFYQTRLTAGKSRELDTLRDLPIDPPIGRLFGDSTSDEQE